MKKRKIPALMAVMALAAAVMPARVSAYELPSAYWSLSAGYATAHDSNNYSDIIKYGVQIIDLISSEPDNSTTANIMMWKSYDVAYAYYYSGDYENSLKYYNIALPYLQERDASGENVYDALYITENAVSQLTPSLDVYTETSAPQKVYGAVNEPNGVLYGQVSDKAGNNDSMMLVYVEYGGDGLGWAGSVLSQAKKQGRAVELALNFPNEGTTAESISASDSWLTELYSTLEKYSTVPVYLRIGAEMNVWTTKCTPEVFKAAFIAIADKVKSLSNVSTVWSVAHTSTWKTDAFPYTADDFYPGDSYVDWVGVNCYTSKYFNGEKQDGDHLFNEICYKAGYAADPVLMIRDVVSTYGGRKPIMISECGSAYNVAGSVNETDDTWAAEHLKQIYSYIPMVYPQVKLIAYFNANLGEVNSYDLDGSAELKAAYESAVQSDWFIQGSCQNSAEVFFKKADGSVSVTESTSAFYAYPHLYGADAVTVSYYLDGALVNETSEIPYKAEISMTRGTHTLKVVAAGNNGASQTREYTVISSAAAETADDFTDTSSLTAAQKAAVNYVVKNGVMSGYDDNTLRPSSTITRAEFATMVCLFMGYSADGSCAFTDAKTHWASKYIAACADTGAIAGIGENKFAPDESITLAQAAKILTVVCGFASSDASYPYGFMAAADDCGLLENLTVSETSANIKRVDVAVMMYNASNAGAAAVKATAPPSATAAPTEEPEAESEWSDWVTSLPSGVNSDDYYIETKTQYSSRVVSDIKIDFESTGELIDVETTYGDWSDWSTTPVSATSKREVETKEEVTATQYHYAHYCTGASASPAYQTSNWQFADNAAYHDLGWFDSPLSYSSDSTSDYVYYVNGERYKCSNGCYRWYLVGTRKTTTTYYRYRTVSSIYTYRVYSDWSDYSDTAWTASSTREVRTRTVYRYREK
ncbi:MAG: S-layer homology domain-containing protein [Firmicutes bacterium]|nr:S-layer homology domain-containing protein [Bacillota bacterium]